MPQIGCPHCLAYNSLPAEWEGTWFNCGGCGQVVFTKGSPHNQNLRVYVVGLAVIAGAAVVGLELVLAPRQRADDGMSVVRLCFTFAATAYLTAVLAFRRLGMQEEAVRVSQGEVGMWFTALCLVCGAFLLYSAGHALIKAGEIRPSLVIGLLGCWFGLRGIYLLIRSEVERLDELAESDAGRPVPGRLLTEILPTYSVPMARVLTRARFEAASVGQGFVGTQHLLLALAKRKSGPIRETLVAVGVTVDKLLTALAPHLDRDAIESPAEDLPITPAVRRVVEQAESAARASGAEGATPEQLLLVLLADREGITSDTLLALGVSSEQVRISLLEHLGRVRDSL